jgi:hypothetical protein
VRGPHAGPLRRGAGGATARPARERLRCGRC